jgi:Flp pilus assembly pilin Flp
LKGEPPEGGSLFVRESAEGPLLLHILLAGYANRAAALLRARLGARLRREEAGQDLIEYAMLAAFIGIAGMLVLRTMNDTIFTAYSNWIDPTIGAPSLWEPSPPLGSGS